MGTMTISSPAFGDGEGIPVKYTCEGSNVSPPLVFAGIPLGAKSLALIVDDPDAPVGTWVHWVLWNIPPDTGGMAENSVPKGAVQGLNDWKQNRWGGPCPPSGIHRYFFRLYALDIVPDLMESANKAGLERAIEGHILARGEFCGTYRRR